MTDQPTPEYQQPVPPQQPAGSDAEQNKVWGILAYIIFLIPLLAAPKDSRFAKYHTNQGLWLVIVSVGGAIVWSILGLIPFLGAIAWIIALLWWIPILIFAILGIVNAANGKEVPLPLFDKLPVIIKY
ncbi:MAG: hypothetical protein LBQ92_03695 [Propionibacteriaceae bacterium]|jgi:uncharacterized membrane protein|nr:hypothetical protein [Propionibacteriaceae bacterium]